MTLQDYVTKHVRIVNNTVRIDAIPASVAFCKACYEKGELVPVTLDQAGQTWTCPKAHTAENAKLATGFIA